MRRMRRSPRSDDMLIIRGVNVFPTRSGNRAEAAGLAPTIGWKSRARARSISCRSWSKGAWPALPRIARCASCARSVLCRRQCRSRRRRAGSVGARPARQARHRSPASETLEGMQLRTTLMGHWHAGTASWPSCVTRHRRVVPRLVGGVDFRAVPSTLAGWGPTSAHDVSRTRAS